MYLAEQLYEKKRALLAAGKPVYDFSVGDPKLPTDPKIIAALKNGLPEVSQYPRIVGIDEFREAVGDWIQRRFSVATNVNDQILPSTGSKEAIFHAPLAFIDRSQRRRRVIYGTPAYPVYGRGALFAGGIPTPVALERETGYRLEPWALDAATIDETAMMWINYPHNPTAATVDLAYLERVAAFCRERDIILCSDECYVDMYLGDQPPPSALQAADVRGILTFHSLSKRSGMTGYRSGFIAGDASLMRALKKVRPNFGVGSTDFVQQSAICAWGDDSHVVCRRDEFRRRRDVMCAGLTQMGLRFAACEATFYVWITVPDGDDPASYAARLLDHGIIVSQAASMESKEPAIRLALVPDLAECEAAIAAWKAL